MFKKFIGFVVILSLLISLSVSAFAAGPLPAPTAPSASITTTPTTTSDLEKQISALLRQISLLQEQTDLEMMTSPETFLIRIDRIGKTDAVVVGSIKVDGSAEYQVEFGENGLFNYVTAKTLFSKNHKGTINVTHHLVGLKPGTEYSCRIRAENAKGVSVSPSIRFKTAPQDYLPLRLLAEAAGYDVLWQGSGKPIVLSGYDQSINIKDYLIINNRAYVKPELIVSLMRASGDALVSLWEMKPGIYRISVQISDDAPVQIEQSFISQLDNDRCSVTLYSDGNDQQLGGPFTVLIEITARSVKL